VAHCAAPAERAACAKAALPGRRVCGDRAGNSRSTVPRLRNGPPVQRRPCRVGEGFAGVERGIHGALLHARGTGRLYKGGPAGQGVCGGEIGFLHDLLPTPPLDPPLSGGKRGSNRYRSHHASFMQLPCPRGGRTGSISVKDIGARASRPLRGFSAGETPALHLEKHLSSSGVATVAMSVWVISGRDDGNRRDVQDIGVRPSPESAPSNPGRSR
jgi:hypothetical protein